MRRSLLAWALALIVGLSNLLSTQTASAQTDGFCGQPTIMATLTDLSGPNSLYFQILASDNLKAVRVIEARNISVLDYSSVILNDAGTYDVNGGSGGLNTLTLEMTRRSAGKDTFYSFSVINVCGSESHRIDVAQPASPWIISPHFSIAPTEASEGRPVLSQGLSRTFCIINCDFVRYGRLNRTNEVKIVSVDGQDAKFAIPVHGNIVDDGNRYTLFVEKTSGTRGQPQANTYCVLHTLPANSDGDHLEFWAKDVTIRFEVITPGSEFDEICRAA